LVGGAVYYRAVPRPELHSADAILDAARDLVLGGGARAATMDRIVSASGAPKGSIYHRFATLDDLLAKMWLRAVRRSQDSFLASLDCPDAEAAAIAAGLAIHDFARAQPGDARLLASLRREDLLGTVTSPDVQRELREVNDRLAAAVVQLARRLYGRASRSAIERTACAAIDIPQGTIRRHLISGTPVPRTTRAQLEAAIRAALQA
jgi:AcrR family transcriptional regulator